MFFHKKETPNLNTLFFNENKSKLKKIQKTLIVSGGSRNGNHLVWSLLDGNKNIPYLPGEDKFLGQIFWRNLRSKKKFLIELHKGKGAFLRKLSGLRSDKWIRVFRGRSNTKIWAGLGGPNTMPLIEFPKSKNKIQYNIYKNYLDENFKDNYNFFSIWDLYLRAHNLLLKNKNKNKNLKYKFMYAESGLRRELLYLAKNQFNFICIVPVRKFESFYFSKVKSRFNHTKINPEYLKEAWEQWYHKTSDYLYLKKRYPKKFIIVPFEDLQNKHLRIFAVKKICKLLKINFEKINLVPTHYKKKVLPNSSFVQRVEFFENKNKKGFHDVGFNFPKEKLPKKYKSFYKKTVKYFY